MQPNEKETLRRMLSSRFSFYCRSQQLNREEQLKLAEKLGGDLIINEWPVLEAHLEYHKAQGFYRTKEMFDMLARAQDRLAEDIFKLYPLSDAIVHALLECRD